MTTQVPNDSCDVLVVGGGMAASFAAGQAREMGADVLLVDKVFFGRGGCAALASGAYSVLMPGEDPQELFLRGTGDLIDQGLHVRAAEATHDMFLRMREWGVQFVKEGDRFARFISGSRGFKPVNVGLVGGGPQMMLAIRGEALRKGVRVVNRVMVTDLLTSDGRLPTGGEVIGAVGVDTRTAEVRTFSARAVVVAAGGYNMPYPSPGQPLIGMPTDLSGDGVAAQLRAGAKMGNLAIGTGRVDGYEFFTPPGLEHFTGQGVRWVNALGEHFMERESGGGAGGRRSALTTLAEKEVSEGRGPVYLDARHFTVEQLRLLREVIPIIMGNYEGAGYDLSKEVVPYLQKVAAHAGITGGGSAVNERGETSIPGLFAAGAGTNGANAFIYQSLWGCSVFGWWTGEHAARHALARVRSGALPSQPSEEQVEELRRQLLLPLMGEGALDYQEVHDPLAEVLVGLGTVLNEGKLETARRALREIGQRDVPRLRARDPHDLAKVLGLRNVVQVGEVVLSILQHRKESRASNLRDDYPYTDNDNWLTWTYAKMDADGQTTVWDEPIPDSAYPYRKQSRGKTLHPLFEVLGRDDDGSPA